MQEDDVERWRFGPVGEVRCMRHRRGEMARARFWFQ